MATVKIRFIANSSVLIDVGDCRLLIDGLYGNNPFFTPIRKEMKKAVFGMNSEYRDIDYLIFTHRHTDHFDAAYINEYVRNNNVKAVFATPASLDPNAYLEDRRRLDECEKRNILHEISFDTDNSVSFNLTDKIILTYYNMDHLDKNTYPIPNAGVKIETDGSQLFFAGDADYSNDNARMFEQLQALDCIFITPLFLQHSAGRAIINKINPKRIVIYHLPDESYDNTSVLSICKRALEFEYVCPVDVFDNEGKTIEF